MNNRGRKTIVFIRRNGFTLIEMAIVMLVIGLLLGGLLPPLSAQIEQQRFAETRSQIEEVKRALIGFAIANGRLPCPALVTSSGVEALAGPACTSPHGLVPAVTLGLNNNGGFVLDGWSNGIRYSVAVTVAGTPGGMAANAFTTAPKLGSMSMTNLVSSLIDTTANGSGLHVCSSGSGITIASTTCTTGDPTNSPLTSTAVAVIYSLGKNGAIAATSTDEIENTDNNDKFFVSHTPDNNFDDQVTWLSYSILFGQMVAAGQLP